MSFSFPTLGIGPPLIIAAVLASIGFGLNWRMAPDAADVDLDEATGPTAHAAGRKVRGIVGNKYDRRASCTAADADSSDSGAD